MRQPRRRPLNWSEMAGDIHLYWPPACITNMSLFTVIYGCCYHILE